jgi:hypothetical protein
MVKLSRNQQGFTAVEGLLLVVILGIIGYVGWFVYSRNAPARTSTDTAQSATTSPSPAAVAKAETTTYTDSVGSYTVTYPKTWKIVTEKVLDDPAMKISKSTLTSPTGTVLNMISDNGGKGGDCQPETGDVPFKAGNACPSWVYLASEKLSLPDVFSPIHYGNPYDGMKYEPADIRLVDVKYADRDGKPTYIIGLDKASTVRAIELNKPEMGAFVNYTFITVYDSKGTFHPYIYAYASGPDEAFLKSADATTIREILRSLKVDL